MGKTYKSQAVAQQQGGVGNQCAPGKMANGKQSAGKATSKPKR